MANSKQIEELKAILEEKQKELESSIKDLKEKIQDYNCNECKDEADLAESVSDSYTSEFILKSQLKELEEVKSALGAIKNNKDYGICKMCDEPISINRLRAKPFAKFCTTCRELYEENQTT